MNSDEKRQKKWRARVSDWQRSGKNMKIWCLENNIVYHQFFYWKTRLLPKEAMPTQQVSFVEIEDGLSDESGVVIECRDVTLKIAKDFDLSTLSRCIQILKEV